LIDRLKSDGRTRLYERYRSCVKYVA